MTDNEEEEEKDTQRAREAGFVAHLVKPVDFSQLRRTLENLP